MIGPVHPTPAFQTRLDMWAAKLAEVANRLGECEHLAERGQPGIVPLYAPERVLCLECANTSLQVMGEVGAGECDMCSRPASIIYTHPVDATRRLMAVTLCAEHLAAGFVREVRA